MQRTYQELYPGDSFAHLAHTVEAYFSKETPLWWVKPMPPGTPAEYQNSDPSLHPQSNGRQPVACLWLGNAVDQVRGDRHTHIFLLYVALAYRRLGIGRALMHQAEAWARQRGDRQIGLQVFQTNQPALRLYQKLGYRPQSIWMVKSLDEA